MLIPGPTLPFGMVNLSPDTQDGGWKAGHDYNSPTITGFSHIHSWVMGGLLTMPATGPLMIVPGNEQKPESGYRSRYSHDTEVAKAGYYAVTLDDYDIRAELTATKRTGFQRYTFPESDESRIIFDLNIPTEYGYRLYDAEVTPVSDTEIEGHSTQFGQGINCRLQNDYTIHFVARLNKPFTRFGGWNNGGTIVETQGSIQADGDLGAFVEFATQENEEVLLKTGISFVSLEQARLNLETEQGPFGWDFDACREAGRKTWNDLLKIIEVKGSRENMTKFYSNLYRTYCARADFSDVNGKYVDMYEKVQQLKDPDNGIYGCDALWNTFWNVNQVWNLATPDIMNKWIVSFLEIYDRGGWLPKGATGIEYSGIMVASHQVPMIVSAYQHGIRNYDVEKVFEAVKHQQTVPGRYHEGGGYVGNRQLLPYMELGYVPVEAGWRWSEAAPASNTMEYSYDDWCAGQLAKALGKDSDYRYFHQRAHHYKNILDSDTKFARPRRMDGTWLTPFDPLKRDAWYAEGNAWQFTWFVPHDVRGLVDFLGEDLFVERLEDGFRKAAHKAYAHELYVNLGNQPNMQAAWLFNHVGQPWQTQYYTTEMLNKYFGLGPVDGYPGDEDQGQMGGWFVMSSMGLFQMEGGCRVKPVYEISTPLFDKVVIHLDQNYYPGETFVIETKNRSDKNVYIQSATLDGDPLDKTWFYHEQLADGGKLVLELGPEPNKSWAAGLENAPPSMSQPR
jgi:predicted alpha-1,2-mannosidase